MDPQEVGALLSTLNTARQNGASIGQLNALLREDGHDFTYNELAAMAKASLDDPPVDPKSRPVTTKDILVAEGQGATASFLDELMGGLATAPLPGMIHDFESAERQLRIGEAVKEDIRETTDQFREAHPVAAFASEVGGGLMVPGVGLGRVVQQTKTAAGRVMTGMGVSAAIGALAGAGEAETLEEMPSMVLGGAGYGALLGGALTGAGQAIGAVAAPVFMHMAGNFATTRVGRFAVAQALHEAARKAGMTGDDFRAIFQELNDARSGQVVPADVSRTLQDLLVRSLGRTQDDVGEMVSRIRERPGGAPDRMARDLQWLADWEGLSNATAKTIAGEVTGRTPQGGRAAVAFERGQEAYRSQLTGPRFDAEMTTLSREAGERAAEVMEAYRFGLVTEMYQDIINTPRGSQNIGQAFSMGAESGMSPARAGLIRRAFPNEKAYRDFVAGAEIEDAFFKLRNLSEAGAMEGADEAGARMFQAARTGSVWGLRAMTFALLSGQNAAVRRATSKQLVEMLLTPGDVNAVNVAAFINARMGGRTARLMSGAGAAASATAMTQSQRMGVRDLETMDFNRGNAGLEAILGGGNQ